MGNVSDFFAGGDTGLKPGQTRDATTLPKLYSTVNIYATAGTSTSGLITGTSGEYNSARGTKHGATLTGTRLTDTYETICDLTGAGTFFGAIANAVVNTTDNVTFKVTADGVESIISFTSTFPSANSGATRAVIGGGFVTPDVLTSYSTSTFGHNFTAWGDSDEGSDFLTINGNLVTVPYPLAALLGLPRLIFDTGLKVEVKSDSYCTTFPHYYAYANYLLDHQI
ncbi:MAG: hypothetical protein H6887_00640 [Hoeflea sp.]|nr:hypothetical protein [Hoeflea sp.]